MVLQFSLSIAGKQCQNPRCEQLSDFKIDIDGCCGEPANYLKGEAKCICSELSLYADYFSLWIAKYTYFKLKYFKPTHLVICVSYKCASVTPYLMSIS